MQRIKVLNEALWPDVPPHIVHQAVTAAELDPVWIAQQGNGHIVAMDGPGDPDVASGNIVFIAEVSPHRP